LGGNWNFSTATGDSASVRFLFAWGRHFECYGDISPNITGRFASAVNHASPAPWFENLLRPAEVGQLVDQLV
jgi:hypothetical protein